MDQTLLEVLLLFSLYAMFGWALESFFKTVIARKFVNSGFLYGPFCPIYGFGALLVIQSFSVAERILPQATSPTRIIVSVFSAILLTTLLEYFTGTIMEALFDSKWWDYSDEQYNLHGRVCLKYSVYWGILSYLTLSLIHPYVSSYVHNLALNIKLTLGYIMIIYFAVDLIWSINDAYDLRTYLRGYVNQIRREELLLRHKRLLSAFPQIRLHIMTKPYQEVKGAIHDKWERLCQLDEFLLCIDDLINHESIQKMRQYRHHGSVNCFEHSLRVSYTSYILCRALGWEYTSAARGGLLHDLFLYDWRSYKPPEGLHGFVHPRLALSNALSVCALNEIEIDIILKHMFPLTWPPPRYKESMIVCLVDSLCCLWEILYPNSRRKPFAGKTTAIINDCKYRRWGQNGLG